MIEAAGILLVEPSRQSVFLVRRSPLVSEPGTWANPGGVVESGEHPMDAAIRETDEETGLHVPRLVGTPPSFKIDASNASRDLHYTLYVVLLTPGQAKQVQRLCRLNWESDAAAWFDMRALPEPMHPGLLASMPYVLSRVAGN